MSLFMDIVFIVSLILLKKFKKVSKRAKLLLYFKCVNCEPLRLLKKLYVKVENVKIKIKTKNKMVSF